MVFPIRPLVLAVLLFLVPAPAAANLYQVNDTADEPDATPGDEICATAGGTCTLRAAFMEAEASELFEVDEIRVPAGRYRLTRPHTPRTAPSSEDGDLRTGIGPVKLVGDGAESTIIEQTVEDRVIHVYRGEATIEGVTIRGGRALSDVPEDDFGGTIPRNIGGGILVRGQLTLNAAVVTDNEAGDDGGGVYGVDVTYLRSAITDNRAGDQGGGVNGVLAMSNTIVAGNRAAECGGVVAGIPPGFEFNDVFREIRITRSQITGNEALGAGISDSEGLFPGRAGGVCVFSARLPFETFGGDMEIVDTLIADNVGGAGGGLNHIGVGDLRILRSTIEGNNAIWGGGLFLQGDGVTENSTVSGNRSSETGGGIQQYPLRVGFRDASGTFIPTRSNIVVRFSTLAENRAGSGAAGIHRSLYLDRADTTSVLGTIFDNGSDPECIGLIDSIGSNLENADSPICTLNPGPGDLQDVDPRLERLADNGGATPTHALDDRSPAIDAYVLGACVDSDQRLGARPEGAACDIGAYEAGATPFEVPSIFLDVPGIVLEGSLGLVLSPEMREALDEEVPVETEGPAESDDERWELPIGGGFIGAASALLVQRGGLVLGEEPSAFALSDWVLRVDTDGGSIWSFAGEPIPEPKKKALRAARRAYRTLQPPGPQALARFLNRPLQVFELKREEGALVAYLTTRAADALNQRLGTKAFKPGMVAGVVEAEPVVSGPGQDQPPTNLGALLSRPQPVSGAAALAPEEGRKKKGKGGSKRRWRSRSRR